jgi:hypothetical protein
LGGTIARKGARSANPGKVDVATGQIRLTKWEDPEFLLIATSTSRFITDKREEARSIEAIVSDFCNQ